MPFLDPMPASAAPGCSLDQAMQRYCQGDASAFVVVYRMLAPRLRAYLFGRLLDDPTADDLLQQTFLHMHLGRGTFVRGAEVMPWAVTIARRLVIDHIRQRRATPIHEPLETVTIADATAASDSVIEAQRMARCLLEQINRLPTSQRRALELVKTHGLSLRQAATVLGTSATGVKLRARRALLSLRALLERQSGSRD